MCVCVQLGLPLLPSQRQWSFFEYLRKVQRLQKYQLLKFNFSTQRKAPFILSTLFLSLLSQVFREKTNLISKTAPASLSLYLSLFNCKIRSNNPVSVTKNLHFSMNAYRCSLSFSFTIIAYCVSHASNTHTHTHTTRYFVSFFSPRKQAFKVSCCSLHFFFSPLYCLTGRLTKKSVFVYLTWPGKKLKRDKAEVLYYA